MIPASILLLLAVLPESQSGVLDAWTRLNVNPGTRTAVIGVDGRVSKGHLLERTAEKLTVRTKADRIDIARDAVAIIRAAGSLGDFHTVYAPWENLGRLPRNERIRVIRSNWIQTDGTLVANTELGLTLRRGTKTVFVPRDKIHKVRIRLGSYARTGEKIGTTAAFIVTLAAIATSISQGSSADGAEQLLELVTFGGAKAGSALAGLFDQYQTIYVSPPR